MCVGLPGRRSFGPGLIFLVLFASRQKEQITLLTKILSSDESQQTALAKQAFDLALLAQGLLKGADLTAFVERSVDVL